MKVLVILSDGENSKEYRVKDEFREGMSPAYINSSGVIDIYQSHEGEEGWSQASWADYWQRIPMYTHIKRVDQQGWGYYWDTSIDKHVKNARLKFMCDTIRDPDEDGVDEILVFAITFEAGASARNKMQDCATSESSPHYFEADSGTLSEAFIQVGGAIEKLKLVQ